MRNKSLIQRTTANARNSVFAALAGAAGIVSLIVLAGNMFQAEYGAATQQLLSSQKAADRILLASERLTMSANMAAATGEARWIEMYERNVPEVEAAIADAAVLASPETAARFDQETRLSNQRLSMLESATLDAVREGRTSEARTILDGPLYAYHREILTGGTQTFLREMFEAARSQYARVQGKALLAIALALGLSIAGGVLLWRRLNASLSESEAMCIEAEQRIKRLALNDVLTGLSNRHALREAFQTALTTAAADKTKLAILMIDLDRFKPINDRYGHLIGDLVLKEVGKRLSKVIRKTEFCGRHGGDEFVALVEYEADDETPRRVGQRIVDSLCEPMTFDGLTVDIGASVGLAVFPTDATGDEELMRKADTALYRAKAEGRGAVRCYSSDMEADVEAKAAFEEELRQAIRIGEIVPYFQPLVELERGTVCGFEVLSRWHHPTRGPIAPSEFIRLAEQSGSIDNLTMAVLQKACMRARNLPLPLPIAINIAPRQIQDERLVDKLMVVLRKTGFPPERLEVELTENALVSDIESAKRVVTLLKAVGIKVALDDFGTGYSSLCYLSELPFDKIKIDRSFIRTLHSRTESAKIVNAIVGLGKSLGVPTIAEGVETERDAAVLRDIGCPIAQGFYFSQAVPAAELPALVARLAKPMTVRSVA